MNWITDMNRCVGPVPAHWNKKPMNHIDRMLDERSELVIKKNKLAAFLESEVFKTLNDIDQTLLRRQEFVMEIYINLLSERIRRATTGPT